MAAAAVLLVCGTAGTGTAPDPTERALTIRLNGPGSVTITPPGTVCTAECIERLAAGTPVTLVATAGGSAAFLTWRGACDGPDETCGLTLDDDAEVEAVFAVPNILPPPAPPPPPQLPPPPPPPPPAPPSPTPAPPAPSPSPSPEELFGKVDRALDGLRPAAVAFNAPTTLDLGQSVQIELLLSIDEPLEQLRRQVDEIGDVEGAVIRVSDDMEARLTGRGFEIQALSAARQAVGSKTTTWRWEIEATESGTHRLHLTLDAFVDVGGERRARTVETFERTLVIEVTWRRRLSGFVEDNWQWLWTAILVPVGAWFLHRRRRPAS